MQPFPGVERVEVGCHVEPEREAEDLLTLKLSFHLFRWRSFWQAEVLPDELAQRPVGDAISVWKASAGARVAARARTSKVPHTARLRALSSRHRARRRSSRRAALVAKLQRR